MIKENITIVDGQRYRPGDEIWDLGSFVATSAKCRKRNYEGLSKDIDKLPHYVDTGSSAFCLDTGDLYKYLRSTDTWYKIGNNQVSDGGSNMLPSFEMLNKSAGTPVGEIISYMGTIVPENYLICDGTEYQIAQYPILAQHFADNLGSKNYFGGDGNTTFAVPDLRGEFLRGSGDNSHTNSLTEKKEGNGSSVGVHQSASVVSPVGSSSEDGIRYFSASGDVEMWEGIVNPDSASAYYGSNTWIKTSTPNTSQRRRYFTERPTNTSVLYCIKYQPTYWITPTDVADEE